MQVGVLELLLGFEHDRSADRRYEAKLGGQRHRVCALSGFAHKLGHAVCRPQPRDVLRTLRCNVRRVGAAATNLDLRGGRKRGVDIGREIIGR